MIEHASQMLFSVRRLVQDFSENFEAWGKAVFPAAPKVGAVLLMHLLWRELGCLVHLEALHQSVNLASSTRRVCLGLFVSE